MKNTDQQYENLKRTKSSKEWKKKYVNPMHLRKKK